jgi:hypothetical protein
MLHCVENRRMEFLRTTGSQIGVLEPKTNQLDSGELIGSALSIFGNSGDTDQDRLVDLFTEIRSHLSRLAVAGLSLPTSGEFQTMSRNNVKNSQGQSGELGPNFSARPRSSARTK